MRLKSLGIDTKGSNLAYNHEVQNHTTILGEGVIPGRIFHEIPLQIIVKGSKGSSDALSTHENRLSAVFGTVFMNLKGRHEWVPSYDTSLGPFLVEIYIPAPSIVP